MWHLFLSTIPTWLDHVSQTNSYLLAQYSCRMNAGSSYSSAVNFGLLRQARSVTSSYLVDAYNNYICWWYCHFINNIRFYELWVWSKISFDKSVKTSLLTSADKTSFFYFNTVYIMFNFNYILCLTLVVITILCFLIVFGRILFSNTYMEWFLLHGISNTETFLRDFWFLKRTIQKITNT